MKRVALIGENTIEYVSILLDIWNNGECAVLIDCQTPPQRVAEMMMEARVGKCYIERIFFEQIQKIINNAIELIPYDKTPSQTQLVPAEIYNKYKPNYSRDEAIVIYSSGTTGKSRGIILSHFAINTNADAVIDYMQLTKDRMYIVKKLTHSSTITGELLVALKTKTPLLIAPVVVPPRYVLSNISKYKVSIIGVNPLLLSMYAQEYKNREYDISSLKKLFVSGSILSDKDYKFAHTVFEKQEIYNVYGLSEAAPRVTAQRRDCCKSNSVGKPIKGVKVLIVNEQGQIVANGNCGIVHVKTPSVFNGYICGEIKHTSLYKGWMNTGDLGYFDEHGELHIVGRVDDMIIIGVHKVYPSEIEKQIQLIADVQECIVTMISANDKEILCCLYSADTEIRKDIVNKLGTALMKYEIPKIFFRVYKLPRTQNGKISQQAVKQILFKELERRKMYKTQRY